MMFTLQKIRNLKQQINSHTHAKIYYTFVTIHFILVDIMPKKKRSKYRAMRSVEFHNASKKIPENVCVWPNKVSPSSNGSPALYDRNKGSTLKRELLGLMENPKEKANILTDCGNRIIHWSSLCDLVTKNTNCKLCGGDVVLTETTIGIATQVKLSCKKCDLRNVNFVRESNYKKLKKKKEFKCIVCY